MVGDEFMVVYPFLFPTCSYPVPTPLASVVFSLFLFGASGANADRPI